MALTLCVDYGQTRYLHLPEKERREMLEFDTALTNYWHKRLERDYPKLYGKVPFIRLINRLTRKEGK